MKKIITLKEIILILACPIIGLSIEKAVENTQWFIKLTGIMKLLFENIIITLSIIGLVVIFVSSVYKYVRNRKFINDTLVKYNVYMRNNDGLFDGNNISWAKVNLKRNFSDDEINILIKKGLITLKIGDLL